MRHRPHTGALCLLLLALLGDGAQAADGGSPSEAAFSIGLPDRPWRLYVELPGFDMGPVQNLKGGARAFGTAQAAGLSISLTLATSPGDPSARSCRDHDWAGRQKAQPGHEDAQLSAQGDRARVEFMVPVSGGEAVQEKHVLLYLQRDGVCAVAHLSKLHYQSSDADALERVLASVRLGS
ncbi:MAG: hypothetical protein ACLQDQ_09175 [Myxococcaceae bacterium]